MTVSSRPAAEFDAPLVACPLCGSDRLKGFDRDAWSITISRCAFCDVRFMNPLYTDRALEAFYASYTDDFERTQSAERRERRQRAKNGNLALVESFVRPGRMMSVGSGDGMEIEVGLRRGWSVTGFDVDRDAAEAVAVRTGAPVLSGSLFDHDLADAEFECVFMDQVLEHPKNPGDYLRLAHRLLRPNGVLYIGTPNIGSISSRAKRLQGRVGSKRKSRGKHYDTWHHLFYYTPRALRNVLEHYYNFDVLLHQGDPKPMKGAGPLRRVADGIRRRYPLMDSSQRVIARPRPPTGSAPMVQ